MCHLKVKCFKLSEEAGSSMDCININEAAAEPPDPLITFNGRKPRII